MNEPVDVLKPFLDEELPVETRLFMFIQLCNEQILIQHMQKQAMMMRMDMVPEDPIYSFACSILRIAKPHLFDEEGNINAP